MSRPRVLVVAGYFDWFSGYQEIGLVRALAEIASVRVLTGDRVNPLFSDAHLEAIAMSRRYRPGRTVEHGTEILRLPVHEARSMVWNGRAPWAVSTADADIIIQVMPGQGLPLAATISGATARRVVLYGDNAAMYAALPPSLRLLKRLVFSATKGTAYLAANAKADALYGYTPDTLTRLRMFTAGKPMHLLPLAFDSTVFFPDANKRKAARSRLGASEGSLVIVAPGKIQPQKRLDTVIDAAERLNKNYGLDTIVVFAGMDESTAARRLRDRARRSPLHDRIHTLPFMTAEELAETLNGADVGVWPTMPAITIQQAMGTGLPVCIPWNNFTSHLLRGEGVGAWVAEGHDVADSLTRAIHEVSQWSDTPEARVDRARQNGWLGTDAIARRVVGLTSDSEI